MAETVVTKNEVGKSCPYCRFPLKAGTDAYACDSCGALHHSDCWQEGNGCSVFGCAGAGTVEPAPPVFNAAAEAPTQVTPPTTEQRLPSKANAAEHRQISPSSASERRTSGDPKRSATNRPVLITLVSLLAICVVGVGTYLVASRGGSGGGNTRHVIIAEHTKTVVHTVTSSSTVANQATHTTGTRASTASTNSAPSLTTYRAPSYSVGYPANWTPVQENVSVNGGYQSKFVDPSDNEVYVLIGDTPGYAGSTEHAAAGVRSTVDTDPSYDELRWAPADSGRQWDWLFIDQGIEQTDTFERTCNTGYGVLGSAPAGSYQLYASLFHTVLMSFRPTCD
jgi:Prokaryotic RING finger family 1